MSWARIDDKANGHEKLLALSNEAFRLWVCGLIYCQANLTDGVIPEYALPTFGVRTKRIGAVALELTQPFKPGRNPLWHPVEGGFQVHDYMDWNERRVDVLAARAKAKDRANKWRGSNGIRNGVRDASQEPFCDWGGDAPETPFPKSSTTTSTTTPHKEREGEDPNPSPFEQFWAAYPKKVGKGDAKRKFAAIGAGVLPQILAAIAWQSKTPQWTKDGGKFIPHPATWLHQHRWEDEPFQAPDATQEAWERVMRGEGRLTS